VWAECSNSVKSAARGRSEVQVLILLGMLIALFSRLRNEPTKRSSGQLAIVAVLGPTQPAAGMPTEGNTSVPLDTPTRATESS
jgi:hypothetical protein